MILATKHDVHGDHEYVLMQYGDWYWQSVGNPLESWGNYGSRAAAVEAARRAGYTIV